MDKLETNISLNKKLIQKVLDIDIQSTTKYVKVNIIEIINSMPKWIDKQLVMPMINHILVLISDLENHKYHNFSHALEVAKRSYEIWTSEWLDDKTLEILYVTWLFHDIGFIEQYDKNEPIWAIFAKMYLQEIWYPSKYIDLIYNLILSTDPNLEASNLLECIIKDADTDNLWRDDFFEKWENLKQELEYVKGIEIWELDWYKSSLGFQEGHRFYTKTNQTERQAQKIENIKKLKEIINTKK